MHSELSDPSRRIAGTRQIVRAAAQGTLERVFIAKDADERIRGQIEQACREAGVPLEEAESMEALGQACRIAVKTAAAGLRRHETDPDGSSGLGEL